MCSTACPVKMLGMNHASDRKERNAEDSFTKTDRRRSLGMACSIVAPLHMAGKIHRASEYATFRQSDCSFCVVRTVGMRNDVSKYTSERGAHT